MTTSAYSDTPVDSQSPRGEDRFMLTAVLLMLLDVSGPGTGVPFHFHGPGFAEVIYGRKACIYNNCVAVV